MKKLTITAGDDIDFSFNSTRLTTANSHWQKDGANITTGNKYRGTTTNTLTLLNATEGDEGMYTLIARSSSFNIMISIGKIHGVLQFKST